MRFPASGTESGSNILLRTRISKEIQETCDEISPASSDRNHIHSCPRGGRRRRGAEAVRVRKRYCHGEGNRPGDAVVRGDPIRAGGKQLARSVAERVPSIPFQL